MPAKARFTTRVEVQWNPVEMTVIDWAANQRHMSRSQFIRDAVASYVEEVQLEENAKLRRSFEAMNTLLNDDGESEQ